MTPDERERYDRIDRQLEFLAQNHAQVFAEIIELKEVTRRHSEQIAQHSEQIAQHAQQISQLGDFILRVGRVAEEQGRRMDEYARRFDERLDALIVTIERYFSNGRRT